MGPLHPLISSYFQKGAPFKLRLSGDFDFLVLSMSERVQRAPFGGTVHWDSISTVPTSPVA